jgi:hypothetical protein
MDRSLEPRAGRATHRVRSLTHGDLRRSDVGRSALDESRDGLVTGEERAFAGKPSGRTLARGGSCAQVESSWRGAKR